MPDVIALGPYADRLRSTILNMKFRHRRNAAVMLGKILGYKISQEFLAIVPVPLHASRLRARGFNQAEAIAEGVAAALFSPLASDALVRARTTEAQSSLPLVHRQSNVRGAFSPGPGIHRLVSGDVLLVDDVVTTGATIAACASVLHDCGVHCVAGAALAIKV